MTQTRTSSAEHTMPEDDAWSGLADEHAAALWRGLEAWGEVFGYEAGAAVRRARAALLAGTLNALGDPGDLLREGRRALEKLAGQAESSAEVTIATLGELTAAYWERIAEQRDAAPTGLASLDKVLGGAFHPPPLMLALGAPP